MTHSHWVTACCNQLRQQPGGAVGVCVCVCLLVCVYICIFLCRGFWSGASPAAALWVHLLVKVAKRKHPHGQFNVSVCVQCVCLCVFSLSMIEWYCTIVSCEWECVELGRMTLKWNKLERVCSSGISCVYTCMNIWVRGLPKTRNTTK